MLNELKGFFDKNENEFGIQSSFITGSYVNSSHDLLSDLDIVLIGSDINRVGQLTKIRSGIKYLFEKVLCKQTIFYCDPAQELFCLLDNENIHKFRVHLIYHPLSRFFDYIEKNDQVIIGWKSNYQILSGNDYLDTEKLSLNNINHLEYFSQMINNLIQVIQNSYLLTTIERSYLYNLKIFKFTIKRLQELDQRNTFKHLRIEHPYNFINELNDIRELIANKNESLLKKKISHSETLLFKLYNEFHLIKKANQANSADAKNRAAD